jgi:hypothetical protein
MSRFNWRNFRREMSELPLGMHLYFWFWTLLVPAGVILVLAGAVVPGLLLLVLFVLDQAIVTPLLVARAQKRAREKRRRMTSS